MKVYQSHFPSHHNYGDITAITADTLPDFDLLCGGFPCQSFSVAGKRRGFLDTRGTLFFDVCRIAEAKRPRLLLLENVKGLLSHDRGETFRVILSSLDELGYDAEWQVCNSRWFLPQNRERVYLVAHLRGTPRPEVFPLGDSGAGDSATQAEPSGEGERVRGDHPHVGGLNGIAATLAARDYKGGGNLIQVGDGLRRLTPVECERLQGFPDGWTAGISDTQRYKCLGNAVSVPVVRAIVSRLSV